MAEIEGGLIRELQGLPTNQDPYLSKRAEHRYSFQDKTQLDLRSSDGDMIVVAALDVSNSGIGFMSRKGLEVDEEIGLRLAFEHESAFQAFVVRRATGTIGGFKVGVVAIA